MSAQPPPPAPDTPPPWSDRMALDFGLKAQARLLPYTLGFFAIGLPVFVWTALHVLPLPVVGVTLMIFALNWAILLWVRRRVARQLEAQDTSVPTSRQLNDRLWRQGLGGGVWAVSLLCICLMAALHGGVNATYLLMVCAGASVSLIFVYSPVLLYLLILAPIAIAGPVMGLRMQSLEWDAATVVNGGLCLAWAIALVLNRHLRGHYHLEYRRTLLAQEREAAQAAARSEAETRAALMDVLSREVQSGLRTLAHELSLGAEHLGRAPVPRQHINAALEEARHLQALLVTTVDNDFAASGQLSVRQEAVDLIPLCHACADAAQERAHLKGLTFSLNVSAAPAKGAARGDGGRITQILDQLIDNAIAYTQSGKVEIRVMSPAEGFIRIEVVDSGPGLSADELELAFKPHGRVARTCAGTSGAGLGLSLSRRLAELMGGDVGGESTMSVGSRFWLDIPWDDTAAAPPSTAPDMSEPVEAAPSLRVLIVASNSLRLAHLRNLLETLGHRCLTSLSPERALKLAHKAPIDACLVMSEAFEATGEHTLGAFRQALRPIQPVAAARILALLPDGDQAQALKDMGITPLLMPHSREAIGRALSRVSDKPIA